MWSCRSIPAVNHDDEMTRYYGVRRRRQRDDQQARPSIGVSDQVIPPVADQERPLGDDVRIVDGATFAVHGDRLMSRRMPRPRRHVHGGAAAVASGHLALDRGGCHPPGQGSTLIFWQVATIWVATVAAAAVERVSSPRPSPTIRESGRRPPGDNVGDSRRPLEESPDHLGKTWGNQLIAHTLSSR